MPDVVFEEKPRSRGGHLDSTGRTLTRNWFCMGTSDEDEVLELALANNPRVYRGMLRKGINHSPVYKDWWDVDVEYGIGRPSGITPDVYSFRIGTQSVHINQALETIFRRRS